MASAAPHGVSRPMESPIITDLRALRRALEGGASVERIVWRKGEAPPPALWQLIRQYQLHFQQVPPAALPSHRRWAAYISPIPLYPLEKWLQAPAAGVALALVGISDARNVGALLRSAAAFGVQWILLKAEGSPLLSTEGIWRASAGALTHLRIVRTRHAPEALRRLQSQGWSLLATVARQDNAIPYKSWDWHKPTLLLFGEEEKGLAPEYLRLCDTHITIPHEPQVQSLNVSVAAGILLAEAYEARRRSTHVSSSPS